MERKGRTGFDHHRYNTSLAVAPDWGRVRSRLRIDRGADTHRVVVSFESPTDRGAHQGHASDFLNASHAARCAQPRRPSPSESPPWNPPPPPWPPPPPPRANAGVAVRITAARTAIEFLNAMPSFTCATREVGAASRSHRRSQRILIGFSCVSPRTARFRYSAASVPGNESGARAFAPARVMSSTMDATRTRSRRK